MLNVLSHCLRALLLETSQEGQFIALIDLQRIDCLLNTSFHELACFLLCLSVYGFFHDAFCGRVAHKHEVRLVFVGDDVVREQIYNNLPSLAVLDNFDIGLNANERLCVIASNLLDFREQLLFPPLRHFILLYSKAELFLVNLICLLFDLSFLILYATLYLDDWILDFWSSLPEQRCRLNASILFLILCLIVHLSVRWLKVLIERSGQIVVRGLSVSLLFCSFPILSCNH